MKPIQRLNRVLFAGLLLAYSMTAFAKEVTMYDKPDQKSNIVSQLDLSTGFIPIFTPKDSQWIKVADPKNGNVGWIAVSDLEKAGSTSVTIKQTYTNDGKIPQTYSIVQYSDPKKIDNKQTQEMWDKIAQDQQAIQQSLQKAMNSMINQLGTLYQENKKSLQEQFPSLAPDKAEQQPVQNQPESASTTKK